MLRLIKNNFIFVILAYYNIYTVQHLYVDGLLGDLSTKTNYQLFWNIKQVCTSKLSTLSDTVNLKLASSVVLYDKFEKRSERDLHFEANFIILKRGWLAKLVARPLTKAARWIQIQSRHPSTIIYGRHKQGLANTLYPAPQKYISISLEVNLCFLFTVRPALLPYK